MKRFCWAQSKFSKNLGFPLFTTGKLPKFWAQADSRKPKREHWSSVVCQNIKNCYCTKPDLESHALFEISETFFICSCT